MQNEISSLQNKIKGLEYKLAPSGASKKRYNDLPKPYTQKDNKENAYQEESEIETNNLKALPTSESEPNVQTFPLRLKK